MAAPAAPNLLRMTSDFSTNQHAPKPHEIQVQVSSRNPDICFNDGNIAIKAGSQYSLVHRGVLARHSDVLESLIQTLEGDVNSRHLEGRPVLELQDSPEDIVRFLQALYDGMCGHLFY